MTDEAAAARLPPGARDALVAELAELVLERAAPEELVLFKENAAEFFRDPGALRAAQGRDEPVGFGLDLAMMTPYALVVAVPVVQFLLTTMAEAVAEEYAGHVVGAVRRRFRRSGRPGPSASEEPAQVEGAPEPLTAEQLERVREIAFRAARGVRLDEGRANVLADAVVGGLVTR
ncbi:hypothetical protein [Nonomuraea sp. NPDC002799]